MWSLFEPLHGATYFTPEARAALESAGLRGFWRGYFAGRAAPLGAVDATIVTAAFFSFAPGMVARALPAVWSLATPEDVLAARQSGAEAALSRLLSTVDLSEASELLTEAAAQVDTAGRVLGAANAALPLPEGPLGRLWHACTVLREHRGDGHVAALVTAGLDGCEAIVWRASMDSSRDYLQPARGWTDEEWAAAAERMRVRGWLDAGGAPTEAATRAHHEIEEATDLAAARPWRALGSARTDRLIELLTPLARQAHAALPEVYPIRLPRP